jgi:hypothetical protein
VIKTEKELLRLIWKDMGLGGHNADIKKRAVIAKEVHKAVEMGSKEWPPEERDEMLDAIAGLFLSPQFYLIRTYALGGIFLYGIVHINSDK